MGHPPLYRWLLLAAVALLMCLWHHRQHRKLRILLKQQNIPSAIGKPLLTLSVDRGWQILLLWGLLLSGMVYHDRTMARQQARAAAQAEELTDLRSALDSALAATASLPVGQAAPPAAVLPSESLQEALDDLKPRYEELFVNYYYLKRCNLISASAFHVMNSSLLYELSLLDAPAGIRNSILQAARGTHDEMYASAPCDAPSTAPLLKNVRFYLEQVVKNVSD